MHNLCVCPLFYEDMLILNTYFAEKLNNFKAHVLDKISLVFKTQVKEE